MAMTCTATDTALPGLYSNTGIVTGTPPIGASITSTDTSHYRGSITVVTLETWTNGQDADTRPGPYLEVGQMVTWTYAITNVSAVSLSSVMVTDSQGVDVSCPGTTLAPRASFTCTATGTVEAGPYDNLGTVRAVPPGGGYVSASDPSHYYGAVLGITLEKQTNGYDADTPPGPYIEAGAVVQWTYMIANTGNVSLAEILVEDDQGLAVNCASTTLVAGAIMTCLATGTADSAQYRNMGTVTARFEDWTVTDWDTSHYHSNSTFYLYLPLIFRSVDG
jgi:hypothetical protein